MELRFSLWLLGGTSPTRLADNLDAGAGVRDIEVVGERIELELTGRRRAVLVLAADGSIVAK